MNIRFFFSIRFITTIIFSLIIVSGCKGEQNGAIEISSACTSPTVTINPHPSKVIVGDEILLSAVASGYDLYFEWLNGSNPLPDSNASSIKYKVPQTSGPILIQVQVKDSCEQTAKDEIQLLIATSTPSPTATSTSTATYTPTNTPTPSATSTNTPTPSITPTNTPSPMPTFTLRPVPSLLSAPVLEEGAFQQNVNQLYFRWTWDSQLQDNWYFAVRIGPMGDEHSRTWIGREGYSAESNEYRVHLAVEQTGLTPGTYDWYVVVVHDLEGDRDGSDGGWEPVSRNSETWQVEVTNPPGKKPTPTPRP